MNKIIGQEILEVSPEHTRILRDRIVEEYAEVIIGMKTTVKTKVGVSLGKGHFPEITIIIEETIEA